MVDLLRPEKIKPLQHPILEALFEYGPSLPDQILGKLLDLPRESAIEDLVTVIQFSVRKFDKNGKEWGYDFSVIHALLLLSYFRAEEKLPFLSALFHEGDDWIEHLIYDFLTEDMPLVFYCCGQNQVPALTAYIKDFSAKNVYSKSAVLDAMILTARKNPDRKSEIQEAIHDLFDFVLSQDDENLIETDDFIFVCTDLTGVVQGFGDQRFLEKVKMLYDKGWIDPSMYGTWEDYGKNFNKIHYIKSYDDIYDWYQGTGKSWAQSIEKSELAAASKSNGNNSASSHSPIKAEPKVGRNAPCPCGSGKKYKKCHGKA